jgi:dephospho-CoA kinase
VVVPLLFESNQYQNWLNRTVTVDCPEATQITRATLRSGLSEQAVRAILAQQFSREQRLARSDDVILNEGTLEKLQPQITRLHQCYLQLAQRNNN